MITECMRAARWLGLVAITAVLSSCSAGYTRLLFFTTTNVGLDVDSKIPTAKLDIDRTENVLGPTFQSAQRHQALPTMGAFRYEGGFFNPRITSFFSGGTAAVIAAKPKSEGDSSGGGGTAGNGESCDGDPNGDPGCLCLAAPPRIPASPLRRFFVWIGFADEAFPDVDGTDGDAVKVGNVRPLIYRTNTATGIRVSWTGTTGAIPDSLKLGFNRMEFAYAPISLTKGDPNSCPYVIDVPSFIGTVDNASGFTTQAGSTTGSKQFFATGAAADVLAKDEEVRATFRKLAKIENGDAPDDDGEGGENDGAGTGSGG